MSHPQLPSQKKTILLVSPYWEEEHRWMVSSVKLAELWQRMGYHVTVVCMGSSDNVSYPSATLTIHTRKDFFLPDPWNYGITFGFSKYVLQLAKDLKPDLIIVNKILFWSSIALLRLRRHGFKVLLLTDALVGITWWPRGYLARAGAWIYAHTLGARIMRRASHIVLFHPQPHNILKQLKIDSKCEIIPTGLNASKYHRGVRHSEHPVVTYVGRLESVKGVDDFAHAAATLKRFMPHVTFQVVGWHKPHHPLVKQYKHTISFLGLRHDIPNILATTDIFVLPSYSEGLSNALMEAMASHTACIASKVGGSVHLLDHGRTGLLFAPGHRGQLLEAMRRLLMDAAERIMLGELARRRIESEFDWRVVEKKYDNLFQRMM